MNRRWLGFLLLMLALLASAGVRIAEAAPLDAAAIKAALRTAAPEENGFVDRVVALVEQGRLPRDIVESTLLWAKRKSRYRFQYFKHGMIARAGEQGIAI